MRLLNRMLYQTMHRNSDAAHARLNEKDSGISHRDPLHTPDCNYTVKWQLKTMPRDVVH